MIQEDEVMFAGASMEKVNLMKPPKQKRSMSIIKRLRDYISSNGKHSCGSMCKIFAFLLT